MPTSVNPRMCTPISLSWKSEAFKSSKIPVKRLHATTESLDGFIPPEIEVLPCHEEDTDSDSSLDIETIVSQQINTMFPEMVPCDYLIEYKKKLRERLRTEEQLILQHENKIKVETQTYSNPDEEYLKPLKPILTNLNAAVLNLNTFTKRLKKRKVNPKVLKQFQENLRKIKRDVNKISI